MMTAAIKLVGKTPGQKRSPTRLFTHNLH
jgi:hypothetical protein